MKPEAKKEKNGIKMICACCGFKITDTPHETALGFVCDRCWDDPNLFFSEKISSNGELQLKAERKTSLETKRSIEIPAIKLKQKSVVLYVGKLKAKELMTLYGVSVFDERTLDGYQREIYENKIEDLHRYVRDCPIAVMPGFFISLREGADFKAVHPFPFSQEGDVGILRIPLRKGSVWIIDGQHRIGGFEEFFGKMTELVGGKHFQSDALSLLTDYELPIIFIDAKRAATTFNGVNDEHVTPLDIERTIFYIINRTQNRIPPSLRDALQYRIKKSGVEGIPVIEREMWRITATSIALEMNRKENSPLRHKMNISGARGRREPIRLNSFVSSLRPLFFNDEFVELEYEDKVKFLMMYWNVLRDTNEEAFRERTHTEYLTLRAIGIYSLNLLSADYLKWCRTQALHPLERENLSEFLEPLETFDWNRLTSPIAHFSGMSGVKEIHRILIQRIMENRLSSIEMKC